MKHRACCLLPRLLLPALVLVLALPRLARAQAPDTTYTLVLQDTPLPEALEALARLTRLDLVYSTDLVADKRAHCVGRKQAAEALLRCLLAGTGLDYVRTSSGAYVLIERRQAPAFFGRLAGQVVDAETGTPLPYAGVLLAEATTGTTTDEAGLFTFAGLLPGVHRIATTYVGYETRYDSVRVMPGGEAHVQIRLRPREVPLPPIVVDGLAQRLPSRSLGQSEAGPPVLAAGAAGLPDVARTAARLPGVTALQPLADLHLQGARGGEHLTLLDGLPIRHPFTLGRHLGAFSPLALQRLTVYKAGFGVEQGSHLTGIVAVAHDPGSGSRLRAGLDPLSFNARAAHRLDLRHGRALHLMLAGRTSLWQQVRDPGTSALLERWNLVDPQLAGIWLKQPVASGTFTVLTPLPHVAFSDLHGSLRLDLAPDHLLDVSAFRARNDLEAELTGLNHLEGTNEDRLILTRDVYRWTNRMLQARYHRLLSAQAVLSLQAGTSDHTSRYSYRALQSNVPAGRYHEGNLDEARAAFGEALLNNYVMFEHNAIRESVVRATLAGSLAPTLRLEGGLEGLYTDSEFNLNNQFIPSFRHHEARWTWSSYMRGTLSPGWHLTIEPGLRLTYLPRRRTTYAEPRLAVRFDETRGPLGPMALRLAAGLYRQFVNTYDLTSSGPTAAVPSTRFWLPTDETMAPPRAYHLSAEVLWMPTSAWTLRLETYYKAQPRLLTIDYVALANLFDTGPQAPLPQSGFIVATRGRTYGGAVRLRYAGRAFEAVVDYAISRALQRFPGRFEDRLLPTPWNVPHQLGLDLRAPLAGGFALHLHGEGLWGRTWALRRAYYDYLALRDLLPRTGDFDLQHPEDHRLPAYLRFDLGLTYHQTLGNADLHVQAFLVNLFDRQNVYDLSLDTTGPSVQTVPRRLPGRYPSLSVRVDY